jgi:hypothetical protein
MAHESPLNPGAYYGAGGIRYPDKSTNQRERDNYYNWFSEQITLYGQQADYYVNTYQLSAHDVIYGEHPTAQFSAPVSVIMMLELSEDSIFLGKFGLESEDEVTAFVTISSFYTSFGPGKEPKSGDVFKLTEYGNDRPGNRDGKMFEITQRVDQDNSTINPLMGHYIWQIKARRVDFTFRPGLTAEKGLDQVTDGSFSGRLSGYTNPQTDTKIDSTNDVDTESKKVFDYTVYGDNDDVYGDYY